MKNRLISFIKTIIVIYALLCILLYFFQESLIFFPQELPQGHQFNFNQEFNELSFKSKDGKLLNGLLFKSINSKGLIFYLHGNSGSLNSWGNVAMTYTKLNYDVFILDYRGYGKSQGKIYNQEQLFEDNAIVYNKLKEGYNEDNIIILGYSIGTGLASKLASENNSKHLILQAPYYSLAHLVQQKFSFIPSFILKYKLETNQYLKKCKMPITIFHGDIDNVINLNASLKLKKEFGEQIHLIILENQGHNGITENKNYRNELKKILIK
ncbi:alpha/beta hydrolase [Tenacibaculum aiptasiae]|uniref:alpha/beta hydrolase n=1 Tax=Tenacibaculum aiptasiae TaxID=426481 RepID=UPI003B5BFC78